GVGLLLFGLLYVPAFRWGVIQAVGLIYHGLRAVLYDIPVWLLHLPAMRAILDSRAVTLFRRHVARPLLVTIVAALALHQAGLGWPTSGWLSAAIFVGTYLLLNSRLGRQFDEAATDWILRTGRRFARDLLPGVIRFFVYMYKELIRDVERVIYTVDEWLRFRQGQSQAALVTKAVLGVGWFFATYLIRIYLNLMIEPTINPVKHFPVVTVAAKIITPLSWKIGPQLALVLLPVLPYGVAFPLVMANLLLLPGFFGFLVWELKENWRLYQANRPRTLLPVVIGHHGETMLRLLKPGIHSGTLPKLYARLRKAEQRARKSGHWKAVRRQRHALEEVDTRIRRFIEREFLPLFAAGKQWQGLQLTLNELRTATNQVQAAFYCPTLEPDLRLRFELQNGGVTASIVEAGWKAQLTAEQMQVLEVALAGLYSMAGDRSAAAGPPTWEWWVARWSMGGRPASAGWQNNAPVAKANQPGG
ncbi:MAG TPA: hypothetical protein VFA18_01090, partial [Gemmataceae bacterium]|nr:hypothetical protein [Gemmataceae bacterium]